MSSVRRYRGASGQQLTLREKRYPSALGPTSTTGYENAAIEYELQDESQKGFSNLDLIIVCLGLAAWTTTGSSICLTLWFLALAIGKALLSSQCTNTLLLVESVGVHIINRRTTFGTLEEYLPWNTISDIFINEVITEQKVLYYLTFIVKQYTNNGEESIKLIPLFSNLKPERECLEYMYAHLADCIGKTTFHEPVSTSAADFSYSKELMKIIRRVIKWQPRQGQQFSTKHLLVTYNHVPWTHQDKTFAVMKFCDRSDAVAFSHAFILTVKLLNTEETKLSEKVMGGSLTKSVTGNPAGQDCCKEDSHPVASPESNDKSNVQEKIEVGNEVLTTNGHLGCENPKNNEEDQDFFWSLRTKSRLKDENQETSINSAISTGTSIENNEEPLTMKTAEIADSSSNENQLDSGFQNKTLELTNGELQQSQNLESVDKEEEDKEDNDTYSECADLPYQYLIERDIERELQNSRLAKENDSANANVPADLCDSSLNGDGDTKSSKESRKSSNKSSKSKQESRDNDSTPDVTTLKSSDITDLVMKGLMFTIRQDEDTVTVVEQKTKLEVDEVLENSEKVETKEGDPCLINSSLLRLEKMVTRIPTTSLSSQKLNGSNNSFVYFIDLANETDVENVTRLSLADKNKGSEITGNPKTWPQLINNKEVLNTATKSVEKTVENSSIYLSDENTDEEMELKIDDEDDEDIIPEALVNSNFFNSTLNANNNVAEDSSDDLLMDDVKPLIIKNDDKKIQKLMDVATDQQSDITPVNDTSVNNLLKLPKVISNEIITNDQIPLGLLKVIRNRSPSIQVISSKEGDHEENKESLRNNINEAIIHVNEANTLTCNGENVKNNNENDFKSIEKTEKIIENIRIRTKPQECRERTNEDKIATLNSTSGFLNVRSPSKCIKDGKVKNNTHITSSNSSDFHLLDSVRVTRLNTKIKSKPIEMLYTTSKDEIHSKETRSLRVSERRSQIQQNNTPTNKVLRSQKRKRSDNEQDITELCKSIVNKKSSKKEVKIKVCKLMNDLTYGVRVVVERIDIKNIRR